jgi:Flp pilus assembly protein TadD
VIKAVICPNCGVKVRAGRDRCPRCRARFEAPDPARAAAQSRRLIQIASIVTGVFVLTVGVLWLMRGPHWAGTVTKPATDPFSGRRQPNDSQPTPTRPAVDIPFLEPAGAARVAYAASDYATSLAQYQAAVEKNPQDAEALSNLAQVLVRLNRTAEAIPYYHRAIALMPDRWAYQFNLARALGLVGRLDESVVTYRRAQQLFPDDYVTTFNLALALHKSGDEAGAVDQYQKAINLQPEDASFRKALAISYEKLQKRAEAAAAYQEYLRLSPAAPDADKVRTRIAELTGPSAPSPTPAAPPGRF